MGQPNNRIIRHQNKSKDGKQFFLFEEDGERDYSSYLSPDGEALITDDKRYCISASTEYPYATEDVAEMAYWLIQNKIIPRAREIEANKIIKRIQDALNYPLW